jgi:hypothetical protein
MILVALSWLPVSGSEGNSHSVVRAGLLTFLASVHGGITIDGTPTAFLPLGLLLATGVITWRAGAALADAAAAAGEYRSRPLVRAGLLQAGSFAAACLITAQFARLGTSSVSTPKVVVAAFVLFAVTGGSALVRSSPLRALVSARLPAWLPGAARDATAVLATYLAAGTILIAGSLIAHAASVRYLFAHVGGGWNAVPVAALNVLAAPNAAAAALGYLAGPGFAVGAEVSATPFSGVAGPVPAFPILGALPVGPATPLTWALMALAPLVAGITVARRVTRIRSAGGRLAAAGRAAAVVAPITFLFVWQGGGGIGGGRLATVGASPWLTGVGLGVETLLASGICLGVLALWTALRRRRRTPDVGRLRTVFRRTSGSTDPLPDQHTEPIRTDRLAG